MHNNVEDTADTAHRLSMLAEYGDALKELSWTSHETIDITNLSMPYASDGVLAFRVNEQHSRAQKLKLTQLAVFQLPSALRGVPARRWTLDFEFVTWFFIANPARDLLVLACGFVHGLG